MKYLLLFVLFYTFSAFAEKPMYTFYTALPKSTYQKMAEDVQRACPQLNINIQETAGSLENLNSIIKQSVVKTGNRFAFVQQDVLDAVLFSVPKLKDMYQPFMSAGSGEINIIVNRGSAVNSVKDLSGKKVAIGVPDSGVWFTSMQLKNLLNINWIPVAKNAEEAILMVLTGEVDALIMNGGTPVRLFEELGEPMAKRVKLIPLTDPVLDKLYRSGTVQPFTYLWQDYPVETKVVQSSFIAATDVTDNAMKELTTCLTSNLPAIKKFGHPKWKEVILVQR